ncbi:MAG: hypothetical protein C0392_01965 [Syntrophus sp. (in: bacteria)]|nr:hypothetical protein [Syntrophus sp. (in: bacteria)]
MAIDFNDQLFQRSRGRRREDKIIRDLLRVGQTITSEINMDVLFKIIIEQTNELVEIEGSTIFVFDNKTGELCSFHPSDFKKSEMRSAPDAGIAGWVFAHKEPLIVNNVSNNPYFHPEIDTMEGLQAKSIMCVPLINRTKQCVGVYQAFNKRSSFGMYVDFAEDDVELLYALSSFVVIAIENSKIYEKLKSLDKAKERIINHLSHEMKTPLAITSVTLERISKKTREFNFEGLEKTINMGKRNINRLLQLQLKIDDILNERAFDEKLMIVNIIEDALGYVEAMKENRTEHKEIMEGISNYIYSFYSVSEITYENIQLYDFLLQINEIALLNAKGRAVEITADFQKDIILHMNRAILEKVCAGLLKNAIENTPDGGRIEVASHVTNSGIHITYRDYGVGITNENQKMIFGGFFHTQDTLFYSSKEPYAFNAGGSGSDLLRMKVLSERCGFTISFQSVRCSIIPSDVDVCSGQIATCSKIEKKADCFTSGGSEFTVSFPLKLLVH